MTITPTSIRGAKLGDPSALLERMWGNGYQLLTMQFPPTYNLLTVRSRNLSASSSARTTKRSRSSTCEQGRPERGGNRSLLDAADLRRVYGKRLKASPNATSPDGKFIYGWTVGKHIYFSMGPTPGVGAPAQQPTRVETVALYSDKLPSIGYDASNAGPCTDAADSTPVVRPASVPAPKKPSLPATLVARRFVPKLSVRAPAGWRVRTDTTSDYAIASPRRLDASTSGSTRPLGAATGGRSRTSRARANGLAAWLKRNGSLAVTGPQTSLLGHPALTVFRLDLKPAASAGGRRVPRLPGRERRAAGRPRKPCAST